MVAVVAGNGLGLSDSAAQRLSGQGQWGQALLGIGGDQAYVNASNGNLVIQNRDELLLGRGLDIGLNRAYNSLGQFDFDNNDNWLNGLSKRVDGLTGTVNTAGSTVIRTDWDGHQALYTFNTTRNRYETASGDGAYDTLTLSGSTWTWTDGDSRVVETYDAANGGRLVSQRDTSGNTISYSYNTSGQLTRVTSPVTVNGTSTTESIYLDYNTSGQITQIRSVSKALSGSTVSDVTRTRVRYSYDTSNRLSTVTVDLSPEDNSVADGKTFTTTYGYDGSSKRVASIRQSDGAELAFVYTVVDGNYRVSRITQTVVSGTTPSTRVTNIAYDTVNRRTTLTDALGLATVFDYDAQGQLTRLTAPAVINNGVAQAAQSVQFGYDTQGNITSTTDAAGNLVSYEYSDQGLLIRQRDATGNTVERSYNSSNQLASETMYAVADPDGAGTLLPSAPATTQYIYDSAQRLRFVISAEGRVTEHRYNAQGLRTSSHRYTGARYSGSTFNETSLVSWASALSDQTQVMRSDYSYDWRGALASETYYARVRADGSGGIDVAGDEYQQIRSVYDAAGRLIQRLPTIGVGSSTSTSGTNTYSYDGLNRLLASTDPNGALTVVTYDDANNQTRTTFADGLIRTQVYNKAGELLTVIESQGSTTLASTQYRYDALGRLRYTQDPSGVRNHVLYDQAGRKLAEIDPDGSLTEFFYNGNNQVIRTLRYANRLSSTALAALVDSSGNPSAVTLGAAGSTVSASNIPRPTADATNDRNNWNVYDATGRLVKQVDAAGAVIDSTYDAMGRLVGRTERTTLLSSTQFTAFKATPIAANATPSANSADRLTRYFYDRDGLLVGTLDGEGYLVEQRYNAAGQKTQVLRYADVTASASRATADLATLISTRATAKRADDISEYMIYDGRGQLRRSVDGAGNMIAYAYDQYGNVVREVHGATIDPAQLTTPQTVAISFVARATSSASTWPTVQVRVDGVVVGTLTIDSSTAKTYTINALNVVPLANHTLDFFYSNDDGVAGSTSTSRSVWIKSVQFGSFPFDPYLNAITGDGSIIDQGSGSAAFDGAGVINSNLQTEKLLDINGALRYGIPAHHAISRASVNAVALQSTGRVYNAMGQLLSETHGLSETDTYQYDSRQRLVQVIRAADTTDARATRYRYDVQGRVTMELSGRGSAALAALMATGTATQAQIDSVWNSWAVKYGYDAAGRRVSVTDANGNKTLYYYNTDGRSTHVIQQSSDSAGVVSGEVVEYRYNAFNELTDTAVYSNRLSATTFASLTGGLVNSALTNAVSALANSSLDSRTQLTYTTRGLLSAERRYTSASAYDSTSFAYNAFGQQTTRTSPTSGTSTVAQTTAYDKRGLATQITLDSAGLNLITRSVYDAFGRVTQTTDARGISRYMTYDRAGRVIQVKDGLGQTSSMTYDPSGNVLTRRNALGQTTTYSYSPFNREITVTSAEGVKTISRYNAFGQLTQVQIVGGAAGGAGSVVVNDSTYRYDADGNLIQSTVGNGSLNLTSSQSYDAGGRLIESRNARGTITRLAYDAANRVLTRTVDPTGLNLITRMTYDSKGQVISETDANGVVTQTSFDLKGQKTAVLVDPAGLALRTEFTYDKRGNRLTVTEAADSLDTRVTQYTYDNASRLITTQVDPSGLNITTRYAYDKNGNLATKTDARGNNTYYAYDNENRLRYTLDATRALSETIYNAAGQVSQVIRYAAWQPSTVITSTTAGGNVTHTINSANIARNTDPLTSYDRITTYAYNKDGQRVMERDALGGLTQFKYDAAGNLIQRTQYANRISQSAAPTINGFSGVTISADINNDRTTRYAYDAANRLVFELDADTVTSPGGLVTHTLYDANGNVARTIQYSQPKSFTGNPSLATITAALPALNNLGDAARVYAREMVYTYDAANRQVHALKIWSASATDRLYTVSENQVDKLGRTVKTIRYNTGIWAGDLAVVTNVAAVQAKLTSDPATDRIDTYSYDKAGRLAQHIDGEGFSESYTYDKAGNKKTYTNQRGFTWNYSYDKAGRLIKEASPVMSLYQADPTTLALSGETASVITEMSYDALGNLLTRIEAYGRPEQRMTFYFYDAMGRQTATHFQDVGVYDPSSDNPTTNGWIMGAGYATGTTDIARIEGSGGTFHLYTEVAYNAFGEAIRNRDVAGQLSFKSYDRLGRVLNEVDQNLNVTQHTYANKGVLTNESVLRLGGQAGALASTADEVTINAAVAVASNAEDRRIDTNYDRLGRTTSTVEPTQVYSYDSKRNDDGSWIRQKSFTYSVFGDVIRQRELLNPDLNIYADTYYYYHPSGKLWRTIDPLGYVTQTDYYAFGELNQTWEFAKALTNWGQYDAGIPNSVVPGAWPTGLDWGTPTTVDPNSPIGFDRRTQYDYDRKGQLITTRQLNVQVGLWAASVDTPVVAYNYVAPPNVNPGTTSSLSADYTTVNVIETKAYDATGNVVMVKKTTVDPTTGAVTSDTSTISPTQATYYFYDARGAVYAEVAQINGGANPQGAATTYWRDSLGNAINTVRMVNLATVNLSNGYPANFTLGTSDPSKDQGRYQFFDKLGRVTRTVDAIGANAYFSYNARGQVAKEWQPFHDVDNNLRHRIRYFDYDAAGRQIGTRTLIESDTRLWNSRTYTADTATYNAFGEITAKQRDGVEYAYFKYDKAGRVWATNKGDGVNRILHYDLQGNLTREVKSIYNLRAATSPYIDPASIDNTGGNNPTNPGAYRTTTYVRDANGNVVRTHLPYYFSDSTVSYTYPTISRQFDRWGNVITETDARGNSTNYRYNFLNQVVQQTQPLVAVSGVKGGLFTPITNNYYDAWGRQVAQRNARGFVSVQQFDARGQLTRSIAADGAQLVYEYDAFGNLIRKFENWNTGRDYEYGYDKENRKRINAVNQWELVNGVWKQVLYALNVFAYDELGQRNWEMTGYADNTAGQVRKYWYDSRGLVVFSQPPTGRQTQAVYNNSGQKISETDGNGFVVSGYSDYDAWGRLIHKKEEGRGIPFQIETWYNYNTFGELVSQRNNAVNRSTNQATAEGQSLEYSYYENGLLKSITDSWHNSNTTYEYDANGNRTNEFFSRQANTYRRLSTVYDALNRVSSITDLGADNSNGGLSINYGYDQNGNRAYVQTKYVQPWLAPTNPNYWRTLTSWYTYDAVDRALITDGQLVNGVVTLKTDSETSREYGYDGAGRRIKEKLYNANQLQWRYYDYDFADRITRLRKSTGVDDLSKATLYSTTAYESGKKTETVYGEWKPQQSYVNDAYGYKVLMTTYTGTGANDVTVTYYNPNGWVGKIEQQLQGFTNNTEINPATNDRTWTYARHTYQYDGVGNVKNLFIENFTPRYEDIYAVAGSGDGAVPYKQGNVFKSVVVNYYEAIDPQTGYKYRVYQNENTYSIGYTYEYAIFNGYKQRRVSSQSNRFAANTITTDYDVNGNTLQVNDSSPYLLNRSNYYITDNNGQIVQRLNLTAPVANMPSTQGLVVPNLAPYPSVVNYMSGAPSVTGINTLPLTSPVDPLPGNNYSHFYAFNGNALGNVSKSAIINVHGEFLGFTGSANFLQVQQGAINVETQSGSRSSYTIKRGDTLRSIAQAFYGDETLWYVLADANGLPGLVDLPEGTVLTVPSVTRSSNTSNNFAPYNPTEALGDTLPAQVVPPPPPEKGCGILGQIIMVVVAIVVTIYTAGAATAALGTAFGSSVGAAVVGGALGAAAGSIVSQGVGMAIGAQDKFSWKSVGIAALGGAVSGALMGIPSGENTFVNDYSGALEGGKWFSRVTNNFFGSATPYLQDAVNAATSSAVTQAAGSALGIQSFSWKAVAVSAAAAPVANKAAEWMGAATGGFIKNSFGQGVLQGVTKGAVTQRIRMATYSQGKIDWSSIAADAFGNALGNSIIGAIKNQAEQDQVSKLSPEQKRVYQLLRDAPNVNHEQALQATHQLGATATLSNTSLDPSSYNAEQRAAYENVKAQANQTPEDAAKVAELVKLRQQVDGLADRISTLRPTDEAAASQLEKLRNLFTYAFINKDVYFDQSVPELLPEGVKRVDLAQRAGLSQETLAQYKTSGYFAALYYNDNTEGYILSNRGTVNTNFTEAMKSWGTNLKQNVFGLQTAQFDQATELGRRLYKQLDSNIEFTGHSLGGGLAAAQALYTGGRAITFNAEGLNRSTIDRLNLNVANTNNVTNYYVPGEILSNLQSNPGIDALAAYYLTVPKNIFALGGVVTDLLAGQRPSFSSFGIAYVPEATGAQMKLPTVSGSPLQLHYMDSVLKAIENRLK